jgi:hypothetical protein
VASHAPTYRFIAFPVERREVPASEVNVVRHQRLHVPPGSIVPGWAMMADTQLIAKLSRQLMLLIDNHHWQIVLRPRPCCGGSQLRWEGEVKPVIAPILNDRVGVASTGGKPSHIHRVEVQPGGEIKHTKGGELYQAVKGFTR